MGDDDDVKRESLFRVPHGLYIIALNFHAKIYIWHKSRQEGKGRLRGRRRNGRKKSAWVRSLSPVSIDPQQTDTDRLTPGRSK